MFKKLTPLKTTEHADLRLLPVTDYGFARTELVAPIVIDEIADVAREFPIVFPQGSALPAALMGVEKDSNAYAAFNTLRKAGALPLIYASLLSWVNIRQGQIGKSHPLPTLQGQLVPTDDDVIRFG